METGEELPKLSPYEYLHSFKDLAVPNELDFTTNLRLRHILEQTYVDVSFNESGENIAEQIGIPFAGQTDIAKKKNLISIGFHPKEELDPVPTPYGTMPEYGIGVDGKLYHFNSTFYLDTGDNIYRMDEVQRIDPNKGLAQFFHFPIDQAPQLDFNPSEADTQLTAVDTEGKKLIEHFTNAIEHGDYSRVTHSSSEEEILGAFPPEERLTGYSKEYPTVPAFPIPWHKKREGEPPKPVFTPREEVVNGSTRAITEASVRKKWRDWAQKQPDQEMLGHEYTFHKAWFDIFMLNNSPLEKDEIEDIPSYLGEIANQLRQQGYGELIDSYWRDTIEFKFDE